MEKKYRIQQVSGNSGVSCTSGDLWANKDLQEMGFVGRSDNPLNVYLGAVPAEGREFFVYYEKPKNKKAQGKFRLVEKKGTVEEIVDEGTATDSHFHGGLRTLTFYGSGRRLAGWSFHCEPIKK